MKKVNIKKIANVFYWLITVLLLIAAGTIALSALKLPGGLRLYTVMSGSMTPKIPVGSLVFVRAQEEYQKGDVITFKSEEYKSITNPKVTITHRLYDIVQQDGKVYYQTKGDANNTSDSDLLEKSQIIGKTDFYLPYFGYVVSFAKTKEGLIGMIIIPAVIIIYSELIAIKNETVKLLSERKKRKLTATEKIEVSIGKEEIKVEKGYRRFVTKILKKK